MIALRIEPEIANAWSPVEVAERWLTLYPPRVNRKRVTATQEAIAREAANADWVEQKRNRLASLSWFMKYFKKTPDALGQSRRALPGYLFRRPLQIDRHPSIWPENA